MNKDFLNKLTNLVHNEWRHITKSRLWELVMTQTADTDLYQMLLTQIYHYTKHNSINQAVAAYKTPSENTRLLGFVYRHAGEELGHENMIIRDLTSMSLLDWNKIKQAPLPPTEALIGYLYYVSLHYGAIARLGYSFWAEDVYEQIGPALQKLKSDLNLDDKNMSFFIAHASIDEKHAEEVRDAILEHAQTAEDQANIMQVAQTTLFLTGAMLDAVADHYLASKEA